MDDNIDAKNRIHQQNNRLNVPVATASTISPKISPSSKTYMTKTAAITKHSNVHLHNLSVPTAQESTPSGQTNAQFVLKQHHKSSHSSTAFLNPLSRKRKNAEAEERGIGRLLADLLKIFRTKFLKIFREDRKKSKRK